jgi:CDP-diacylglycerol--inositol 3-phosphatidyltransferase
MNPVFFYIPNLIGYFRLILLIISLFLLDSLPKIALFSYFLSAILDAVDGHLARKFKQESTLGSGLDMITDRCTTTSLTIYLSSYYDLRILTLLVILDFSSHFLHMLKTVKSGKSHKECDENTPFLMKLYYSNKTVLFLVCGGNEIFFMGLYGLVKDICPRWVVLVSFPVFAFKQVMNLVQLLKACEGLASLDDPRRLDVGDVQDLKDGSGDELLDNTTKVSTRKTAKRSTRQTRNKA